MKSVCALRFNDYQTIIYLSKRKHFYTISKRFATILYKLRRYPYITFYLKNLVECFGIIALEKMLNFDPIIAIFERSSFVIVRLVVRHRTYN